MLKRFFSALALFAFCCSSSLLYADTSLTEAQIQELQEIFNQLEVLNSEQLMTIENLKMQNSELLEQSNNRQKILEEQKSSLNQLQASYKKEKISWAMIMVTVSAVALATGLVIGRVSK